MKWPGQWTEKYAWYPVKLISGKWIWGKPYYCRSSTIMEVKDDPGNIEGYGMEVSYIIERATIFEVMKE